MKNPNSNIEELFKNTFENYQADVRPETWSNIQKKLSTPSNSGRIDETSSSTGRWALVAAIMALSFLGIWYFTQENKIILVEKGKDMPLITTEKSSSVVKEEMSVPVSNTMSTPEKKKEVVRVVSNSKLPLVVNAPIVAPLEDMEHIPNKTINKLDGQTNPWQEQIDKQLVQNRSEKTQSDAKNKSSYSSNYSEELRANIIAIPAEGTSPLTVSLQNFYAGMAKTNIWDFGDGSALDSSSFKVNHTYDEPGVYKVILTVRNESGKTTSTGTNVNVDKTSSFDFSKIVNTFTPNDDGVNDIFFVRGESIKNINVAITDVNEKILYNWNTLDGGWDGKTYSGELVQEGTYYYILNAIGADGKKYVSKGPITVKR